MEKDENTLDVQEEIQENDTQDSTEVVEPEKDWKAEAAKWQRLAQKAQKPQKLSPEASQPKGIETDSLIENIALINSISDVIPEIQKESKELGIDLTKFVKSNAGQRFIETLRSEKKATDSTLTPSNRGFTFNGKDFKEVIIGDSSKSEKQAAWEAKIAAAGKKGGSRL